MKQAFETLMLAIAPLVIGTTMAIVAYLVMPKDGMQIWNAIGLALLIGIFTSILQLRISMSNMQKSTEVLVSHEMLQNIIKVIDEAYACHRGLGDICRSKFSKSQQSFQEMLSKANNKEYKINKDDIHTVATLLIKHAYSTIYATSFVKESSWWRTSWSKSYLVDHQEARERNVTIERVFIFPNQKVFDHSQDILYENLAHGVIVKYIFENRLQKKLSKDIIIIDDKFSGSLVLNKREMQEITLSNNITAIERAKEIFTIVSRDATVFNGCKKP